MCVRVCSVRRIVHLPTSTAVPSLHPVRLIQLFTASIVPLLFLAAVVVVAVVRPPCLLSHSICIHLRPLSVHNHRLSLYCGYTVSRPLFVQLTSAVCLLVFSPNSAESDHLFPALLTDSRAFFILLLLKRLLDPHY
ncbi:hypothetical protein GQ42DRAFT_55485 [Ramicandelaber brevisporus]|nr:hypothetical protein GQ42DRAFT_55485 [Ramicandelaber brevisporus]